MIMKKYPLLILLIISSLLVTIPGIALNLGFLRTKESFNYSPEKVAASSAIHEIKTMTSSLVARLTKNESSLIVEETLDNLPKEAKVHKGPAPSEIPGHDLPDVNGAPQGEPEDQTGQDDEQAGDINDPEIEEGPEAGEALHEEAALQEKASPDEDAAASDAETVSSQAALDGAFPEGGQGEMPPAAPIDNGFTTNPVWQTVDDGYFLDACFIGDSRTKGFGMYSGLTTTTYAKVGLQLYKVFDDRVVETANGKLTVPEALAVGPQFGKIYLMFGLNEMGWGNDEMFMQKYYELIDTIKALQPGAIIYVQQVIHVTGSKAAASPVFANDKIDHRNELLRKVAADEYVYYIELNDVFTDDEGKLPAECSFDGVQISGAAMPVWEDSL